MHDLTKFISIGLVLSMFLYCGDLHAQRKAEKERGFGSFQFQFGAHVDPMPGLNSFLVKSGYPEVPNYVPSIGVGGYRAFKNKWILGAEIQFGLGGAKGDTTLDQPVDYNLTYYRAGHYMYFGYVVFNHPIVKLYPHIGWTGSLAVANFHVNTEGDVDFSQTIDNPNTPPSLFGRSGALSLGIGADIKTRKWKRSPVIGIRLGYEIAGEQSWQLSGTNTINGPRDAVGGFYAKLNFGFINHDSKQ